MEHAIPHGVDGQSRKSRLLPPTPGQLEYLAQQARLAQREAPTVESLQPAMRSLRRRFSRQEIEEMVARSDAGADTPALRREFGISTSGLRQLLRAEDVAFRRQAVTPEDADRAIRRYESGSMIRQVVERVGYSFGTIQRMFNGKGVVMRVSPVGKRTAPCCFRAARSP
jgi:hypothetical protein